MGADARGRAGQAKNAESDKPTSRSHGGEGRRRIDYAARAHNRQLSTQALLHLLQDAAPDFFYRAEVVGAWVWIAFPSKQPGERLMVES